MESHFISIVIFLTVSAFGSTLSSDNEDYTQMKELVQSVDKALRSLIKDKFADYSKVHKLNRRSVPEFRSVLIEAQNKLNERLLKGQRRIKKFKIQRRSDDSNEMQDDSQRQPPLQFSESIQQQQQLIPVYRETFSGYPAITEFDNKRPVNIFYRDVRSNNNRLKRNEDLDEEMRDTAEEYEERIPLKENLSINKPINKPDYNSNEKSPINSVNDYKPDYSRLSEFSHTIKHDGRGYHTSYFTPNIDKTTTVHKQKDSKLNSNANEYWKSETEPKAVKNLAKPDLSAYKTVPSTFYDHKSLRPSPRPAQQIKYSPKISPVGYNAHSYYPFDQNLIRTPAVVYGTPIPSELSSNLMFNRKPVLPNPQYRQKAQTSPVRDSYQRPNGQYRRQPIFDVQESQTSTQKPQVNPVVNPPIHWTKVVAELNDQKNRISDDWRSKSRPSYPRQQSKDLKNDRFYKVGASINMN